MNLLRPPKKPFHLALYCIIVGILLSIRNASTIASIAMPYSTEGTNAVACLFFFIIGYFAATYNGPLKIRECLVTAMYVMLPILVLRLSIVFSFPFPFTAIAINTLYKLILSLLLMFISFAVFLQIGSMIAIKTGKGK